MLRVCCLHVLLTVALVARASIAADPPAGGRPDVEADVVVYGATAAGLTAAIQARRMDARVVVVEASSHVGGMTTGGLSSSDVGNSSSIGGLAAEFYTRVGKAYGSEDRIFHFEPKVAAAVFAAWLQEAGVEVITGEPLELAGGVSVRDGRIESFRSTSGRRFRGRVFIDASFEGDLMAKAGVSYTVGREPESQYGESLAGLRRGDRKPRPHYTQGDKDHFTTVVDPFVVPGDPASDLLPWVRKVDFQTFVNGAGDKGVQAYNYRLCVTDDPDNRIPFEKPEGYRELDHELLLRVLESGDERLPILIHKLPNRKYDWNSMHAVGTDLPGASWPYPEANHEERARIAAQHALYAKGVMWTLAYHPRTPESIRSVVSKHGWCRDEFTDLGGFSPQLYVREGRRMLSDAVVTQGVCMGKEPCDDPVALGSFGLDSHAVQYFVNEQGNVHREGVFWLVPPLPYGISWRAIRPKPEECTNLLVPSCVSASHAAYGSLRMEPVYMAIGQAAGTAAVLAIRADSAVQNVAYPELRKRLDADGARLIPVAAPRKKPAAPKAAAVGLSAKLLAEDRGALIDEIKHAGNARRGANVFHTRHLTCTQCHVVGKGDSPLGPGLSAMPQGVPQERLVAHLVESLLDPSAKIRPEYQGVTIVLDNGKSLSGLVVRESDCEIVIKEAASAGSETVVTKTAIAERIPAATSLMPAGLVNLLAERKEFIDLVRYLAEVAAGGPTRAEELAPDAALLASPAPAAYEADIDHAAYLADWADPEKSAAAFERGGALYARVCANCHGTLDSPGSLPTAPRFAEAAFKAGSDPHAIYRTLTHGVGLMVAQGWMVPSQKYDVIHYLRETFLKDRNPSRYTAIGPDYLASLPKGSSRGPKPSTIEPWLTHDYGPFLAASIEVGNDGANVARKGLAVRLDPGGGGVGRGHAWILYDLDTLRVAAFWTGDMFIDWAGINFDGRHGIHPRVAGDVQARLPAMPGWADPATGRFADARPLGRDKQPYGPLPRNHARFRALHHARADGGSQAEPWSAIVLDYVVGETPVLETASLGGVVATAAGSPPVLTRSFFLGPRPVPLAVRLAAAPAAAAIVGPPGPATGASPAVVSRDGHVDLLIPAGPVPLDLAVCIAAADPVSLASHAASFTAASPRTLVGRPAPPLWLTPVEASISQGTASGPFATDVLALPDVNPWNAQVRLSGIDFIGPDAAVLCTWDGDVWTVRGITAAKGAISWRRIASGLYQPLGIKVIDGVVHVGCRDRIVKLVDIDGDGMTDRYDTFNDDHQVTEHFHEFAMGLETDAEGRLYYAKSGRHGLPAVVPHHGTLLQVARDGSATEIVATGFRAANGVCVEEDGTFWVTDQEGFWCPKNRINHVRHGGFYGNLWGWTDITDTSDSAMEQPACWITNAFDRSPAELLRVASTRWTPLTGALLELSYGEGRLHLVLTEPARSRPGLVQGGLVALPMPDLLTGVMRGRFHDADGHLYACGLYAWAGNRTKPGGFFRVRRTHRPLHMPIALHAEPGLISLSFDEPLDKARVGMPGAWRVKTWGLERTRNYGSKHIDESTVDIRAVEVSSDGRRATLRVPEFAATWCYSVEWAVSAADGAGVRGVLHGTMH